MQTIRRRRITATGTKPVGTIQHDFKNFYLYGAIAPTTGESFFLQLPQLNAAWVQVFLDELARAYPESLNVLLLDNSRCHTARTLTIPDNIILVFQEPYAPDLNPSERVWQDLKDNLAWEHSADLDHLQDHVADLICTYDTKTLTSLTAFPYFVQAVNAVCL